MGNFWSPDEGGGGGQVTGDGSTIVVDNDVVSIDPAYEGQESISIIGPLQVPLQLLDGFELSPLSGMLEYTDSQLFITGDDSVRRTVLITDYEALQVTTAGATPKIFPTRCAAIQVEYDGVVTAYRGKWVNSLTLPSLTGVTSFSFDDLEGSLTSFVFPGLASLTVIAFPALKVLGTAGSAGSSSFQGTAGIGVTTLSLPVLEYLTGGSASFTTFPSLVTLSLPSLKGVHGSFILGNGMTALENFSFGTALKFLNGNLTATVPPLNAAGTNNILITLDSLDGTNGTILYTGRTINLSGAPAAPTGAGLTAKTNLIGKGNTVTTN
jgi:hypothetical protein